MARSTRRANRADGAGRGPSVLLWLVVLLCVCLGGGASVAQSPAPPEATPPAATPPAAASPSAPTTPAASPPDASPGELQPDPPASPAPERPPFAQELIARALLDGSIDYTTSLVDRAYALFGDDRLPADLWGAGSTGEDGSLGAEVQEAAGSLPPDAARILEPFFLRPTDPRSPLHGPAAVSQRALAQAAAPADPPEPPPTCEDGWLGNEIPAPVGVGLKIWAECDGNEQDDIDSLVALGKEAWGPMVALMGPARPDQGSLVPGNGAGRDISIDVYLVKPLQQARGVTIPARAFAAAWPTDWLGKRASGFVLVPRGQAHTPYFRLSFVHELFHVLQFAHNAAIMNRPSPVPGANAKPVSQEYWFTEASAQWAATYFDREDSATYHDPWFRMFQHDFAAVPLQAAAPDLHQYAAYIWPFFMEQEVNAAAIAAVWKGLESINKGDWEGADKVVDRVLPFKSHFRDFAVRNVDQKLPGNPVSPRYQQLDKVPLDIMPQTWPYTLVAEPRGTAPATIAVTIPSLTARYLLLKPDKETRQVTIEFNQLEPGDALDVDALIKVKSKATWTHDSVAHGDKLHYCFNKPEEDVEKLELVLSNHALDVHTTITGDIKVQAVDVPCGQYRVQGEYEVRMKAGAGPIWNTFRFDGEFSLTDTPPDGGPSKPSDAPDGAGRYTGSAGRFEIGQTGCGPAGYDIIDAEFVIVADVEDEQLSVWIVPQPPANDPLLDVFNTRLDLASLEFGAKHLVVPLDGGTFRWGGGALPLKVECDGIPPGSGGRFTVIKTSDE